MCLLFQRLQVDLERSASINSSLGSRVSQCSLNGLADFLYRYTQVLHTGVKQVSDDHVCDADLGLSVFSFQRKVEMFHEGMQSGMFGDNEDGYVSKTIALVNCCPPFRYQQTLNELHRRSQQISFHLISRILLRQQEKIKMIKTLTLVLTQR